LIFKDISIDRPSPTFDPVTMTVFPLNPSDGKGSGFHFAWSNLKTADILGQINSIADLRPHKWEDVEVGAINLSENRLKSGKGLFRGRKDISGITRRD
jgi:hypothetical protein